MLIETWVAVMITICVFIIGVISLLGWIIEGERLAREVKKNKKLIKENERLHKIISQMNGLHNIQVADEFYNRGNE